jgi:hypothetical protein
VKPCPRCGTSVNFPDPRSGAVATLVSPDEVERTARFKAQTVLPGKKSSDSRMSRGRPDPRPWQREPEGSGAGGDPVDPAGEPAADAQADGPDGRAAPDPAAATPGSEGTGEAATPAEPEPEQPPDPGRHRFNPEKQARMIALDDLAAADAGRDDFEWRMSALDPASEGEIASKSWTGRRFLVVGLLVGGALAAAIWFIGLKTRVFEAAPKTPDEPDEVTVKMELIGVLEDVLRRFLAEPTIEGKLPYVRSPEVTRNNMIEYFSRPDAVHDLKLVEAPVGIDFIERDGHDFVGIIVSLSDLSQRGAIFEEVDGKWLLDWESFVGYGDMGWQAFLAEEPEYPVRMRVLLTPDDYFNFAYADPEKFACFGLRDPEGTKSCWAYCEKGSPTHRQLADAVFFARERGTAITEAILLLSFKPEGKGRSQVWIEEFIDSGHFIP